MARPHVQHPARRILAATALGTSLLAISSCRHKPPFDKPIEQVPRREVLRYADRLHFDSVVDPRAPRADTTRLPVGSQPYPLARIDPERDARNERPSIGLGRIVARIKSDVRYEPLGLAPGFTYFWVDSAVTHSFRVVMIPEDSAYPLTVLGMTYLPPHPSDEHAPARARWWVFGDSDSGPSTQPSKESPPPDVRRHGASLNPPTSVVRLIGFAAPTRARVGFRIYGNAPCPRGCCVAPRMPKEDSVRAVEQLRGEQAPPEG